MQATITKQTELIILHDEMRREQEVCGHAGLRSHYDHLLLSLRKIIEFHGPTTEYEAWISST